MSSKARLIALLAATLVTAPAWAQEAPPALAAPEAPPPPTSPFTLDIGPLPVEFHGYVNQAYVKSDHNRYYHTESREGSFHLTEAALNAAAQVTDRTRIVVQIASVMNDVTPNPRLVLDFGFVDHRFSDAFGVRLGRFRNLINLYSEVWDTDIARLPIFLPSSVYDPVGRQAYMNAQGIQIYGSFRSDDAGSLDYAATVGALAPFQLSGVNDDVDFITNARVIWNTPIEGLRIGGTFMYTHTKLRNQFDLPTTQWLIAEGLVPATFTGEVTSTIDHLIRYGGFAELNLGNWTLSAEYMRLSLEAVADDPALAAVALQYESHPEDFYLMTSYRFNDWFTAGGYASVHFNDVHDRGNKNPATHNFDYAATFRFDLNAYLAFKAEVHRIYGTGLLDPQLNDGEPTSNNGWLFALRASAAF